MNRGRRTIAALAVGVALLGGVSACSTRPPVDEVWLYYRNGPIETKRFDECIEPNTKGKWEANNDTFALPTSLRTWNVTPGVGGDTKDPITVGSRPDANGQAGPQMHVWLTTEFYLNTNCADPDGDGPKTTADSPVVQFWEKTGRRYGVSDGRATFNEANWVTVLRNTLVPVQAKAIQRVAREYDDDALDTNVNNVWDEIEEKIQAEFTEQLRLKVGGDYFCGVGYSRASSTCPPVRISITDINHADPAVQAKRTEVRAAIEDAKKRLVEAQAKVDEARLLSQAARDANYMRLKELETFLQAAQACAANPNCTLVITPPGGGTGVNVNAGGASR